MAIARLHVIIVFVIPFLQVFVHGQQQQGCSCSTRKPSSSLRNLIASDPRIGALIANVKSQKQLMSKACNCENKGVTFSVQSPNENLQQNDIGLQQQQVLDLPLNSQQVSVNIHPPLGSQNVQQFQSFTQQQLPNLQENSQQTFDLKQQSINLQPVKQQHCLNLQLVKEPNKQSYAQQQIALQQQCSQSDPLNSLQLQMLPVSSLPVENGQVQGFPSQVSQGVLLSNLGLSSSVPSLFQNSVSDQISYIIPQNNAVSYSNVPTSELDGSQITQAFSVSPIICSDYTATNPSQTAPLYVPLSTQYQIESQQNLPVQLNDPANTICYQQSPSQATIPPHQPVQSQQSSQMQQPIQTQYIQSQPVEVSSLPSQSSTPAQSTPSLMIQSQLTPNQPIQTQPAPSIQNQEANIASQSEPQSLTSFLLSQLQPSSSSPEYSANPSPYSSSRSSKSSTMKALLPLLFNLLKEKNFGCNCPPNYNCGCMNSNMQDLYSRNAFTNNNHNNYNGQLSPPMAQYEEPHNSHPEPQVSDGYANQIKYGRPMDKEVSQNYIESEEIITPSKISTKKAQEKKASSRDYQNYKKKINESIEYEDDYDESYENED